MYRTDFINYLRSKGVKTYLTKDGKTFQQEAIVNGEVSSKFSKSTFCDIGSIDDAKYLKQWVSKNIGAFRSSTGGGVPMSSVLTHYIDFLTTLPGSSSAPIVGVTATSTSRTLKSGAKNDIVKLLETNKNLILQGAPGVGKTYITRKIAVSLCEGLTELGFNAKYPNRADLIKGYNTLVAAKRIGFITFHQSLDYEEFVEGLKPDIDKATNKGTGTFSVKPGLFKKICDEAKDKQEPYVLIIDEINRANISKVLGELITLIEPSKRSGGDDPYSVTLPYSQEEFSVPSNLFIIGTMNTADRSLGSIDYAIRRRFAFKTLISESSLVTDPTAIKYFNAIKDLINIAKDDDFETDDIMIGHSYFMGDFKNNLNNKIIPLLLEYFRDGVLVYEKVTSLDHSSVFSSKTVESKKDNLKVYLDEKAK